MKKELIDSIHTLNKSALGREKLYHELSIQEKKIWQHIEAQEKHNWVDIFSEKALEFSEHIVIREVESNKSFKYKDLDNASSKIASFILAHISNKQIAINKENSFEFMATLIAINKTGRLAILMNNREPQERLETLAKSSNTTVVFGDEIKGMKAYSIASILKEKKPWKAQFQKLETTLEDPAFVIFTSGTSGPSKPALFSHRRMIGAGVAWSLRTAMDSSDNCYITLPLYHGNALAVAFSAVVFSGATAILRPKFSVSSFWSDINQYKASHMVYIGELWRYLLNANPEKENLNRSLKVIFGNGLNSSLWSEVIETYSIEHVVEHFGSTEMPSGALTNWFNVAGYCGYLPPEDPKLQEMVLVDEALNPIDKESNQYGEALFLVPSGHYRGYLNPQLDESKITRNLFDEGDVWWRSGDLLKVNSEGFYSFIERMGDSYRFKGENVACVDVEEAIRKIGKFEEVVVYGIELPNIDGKIGMASLVPKKSFKTKELKEFYEEISKTLASYALPYIIKIQEKKHQTTSTLKIQKAHLAKEKLDRYAVYPHYILINGEYIRVDKQILEKLLNSEIILGQKVIS